MPKNMGKGGKNRKRGVNKNEDTKRELVLAEEDQTYGQVTKMLGMGRLAIDTKDGEVIGVICGRMRKKVWITVGDVVLVSTREFEDGRVDVIGKYNADEARQLAKEGHFKPKNKVNEKSDEDHHQGGVLFIDEDSEGEGEGKEGNGEEGSEDDDPIMQNPNKKRAVVQEEEEDEDVDVDDL